MYLHKLSESCSSDIPRCCTCEHISIRLQDDSPTLWIHTAGKYFRAFYGRIGFIQLSILFNLDGLDHGRGDWSSGFKIESM